MATQIYIPTNSVEGFLFKKDALDERKLATWRHLIPLNDWEFLEVTNKSEITVELSFSVCRPYENRLELPMSVAGTICVENVYFISKLTDLIHTSGS